MILISGVLILILLIFCSQVTCWINFDRVEWVPTNTLSGLYTSMHYMNMLYLRKKFIKFKNLEKLQNWRQLSQKDTNGLKISEYIYFKVNVRVILSWGKTMEVFGVNWILVILLQMGLQNVNCIVHNSLHF